jgi:phosphatidylinositol-4,5-bisphosphate 3-kinase
MYTNDPWLASDTISVPVSVLMPNGLILSAEVERDTSLRELKEDLFESATREPLHGLLRQDRSAYIFVCVNEITAEPEELTDESRKLFDIKPFYAILRLIEKRGGEAEKSLNAQIGVLIGKGMHEFDAMKNSEVNDFRYRMSLISEKMCQERGTMDWRQRMKYLYPERMNTRRPLPSFIQKKITRNNLVIEVSSIKGKMCQRFTMKISQTVQDAISYALSIMDARNTQHPEEFILKVVGQEEFLVGDNLLLDYMYVQECLGNNAIPMFIILPVSTWIDNNAASVIASCNRRVSDQTFNNRRGSTLVLAESITRKYFVNVQSVSSLNGSDGSVVIMKVGIFHGVEPLSPVLMTDERTVESDQVTFNQPLMSAIIVKNLTQVSRICFGLFECKNNKHIPLSWVNLTVFDYNHRLRRGCFTIPMWTHASDLEMESDLNVLGSNYPISGTEDLPMLTVSFGKVTESNQIVTYSGTNQMMEVAFFVGDQGKVSPKNTLTSGSKHHLSQLKQICEKTPVNEIMEQDKELFRLLRADCCSSLPHALPHVLASARWHERADILIMNDFLKKWPLIEPEHALCLLGPRFPSLEVRQFAIRCLEQLADDCLLLYLLQLVQSLRNEVFLFSHLGQFLLRKALANQIIGHHFFWLLRSEMQDPAVTVCFGLLLEAYCRGAPDHMPTLSGQVDSLKKLSILTEFMRLDSAKKKESREKQKEMFQQSLSNPYYKDSLKNFRNTLNPRINLGLLKVCLFLLVHFKSCLLQYLP